MYFRMHKAWRTTCYGACSYSRKGTWRRTDGVARRALV
jgi:hypothetical protein